MEELVSLIESGMDWESYDRHFTINGRPPRELFLRFVAKRLETEYTFTPSAISLRVDRAWNGNHLYLIGSVDRAGEEDRVEGEVVWMPNLNNFRGHLLINPPTAEELQLEEIEELKKHRWHLAKWAPTKAGHTHDHCGICWQALWGEGDEAETYGYTDGHDWVCQKCYVEHLQSPAA